MSDAIDVSLYACVLRLVAERDCTIPATQGHLAHAAFLDIVREADPQVSEALHGMPSRKPFTVSPLQGLPQAHGGRMAVRAGQMTWMRVTLLDGVLFQTFVRRFLFGPVRPTIRLGGALFTVTEVLVSPDSHAWAGYGTMAELAQRALDAQPPRKLTLQLASPTAFSLGHDDYGAQIELFPQPGSLFANLLNAWNARGYQPLNPALREYVQQTVVVARYSLETKVCELGHSRQLGAVGQVTYLLRDQEQWDACRALGLLADFAFYAGIGYKTTMGMGMSRRLTMKDES